MEKGQPLRQQMLSRILIVCMVVFSTVGCAAAWVTPTLPAQQETPTPPAANPNPGGPTPPDPDPVTPTPPLAEMVLTDALVQHWSNPNDARELLHDGTHLWVGTPSGLVRWAPDGTYEIYTSGEGLASEAIRGLAQDGEGHLWVGYADHGAWSEYAEGTWHTYATRQEAVEASYQAMLSTPHFNPRLWNSREESDWLWLPTVEGTVQAYDGEMWRTYGEREGVVHDVWLVTVSPQGRVWAVGRGVSTTEEGVRSWVDHSFFSSVADSDHVTDAVADAQGLWLTFLASGEESGGACRLQAGSEEWEGHLHEFNPAIPATVYDVRIDKEDTIWLCGTGGLSYRQEGKPWETLPLDDMTVQGYAHDGEDTLWLGTTRGIWHTQLIDVDGTMRQNVSQQKEIGELEGPWRIPSPLLDNDVRALAMDSAGGLWIGTEGGLSHVDAREETTIVSERPIRALAIDENDTVWLAAEEGLYRLEGDAPEQVAEMAVEHITLDPRGTPWIYTQEDELYSAEGEDWKRVAQLQDLAGAPAQDVAIDGTGKVFLATAEGLGILSPEGEFRLITDDEEEGPLSQDVRAVAVDSEDVLWVATAKGLARRRPDGHWTRFTAESTGGGLRAMEMWDVATAPDGTLWMVTSAGISRRTPQEADWAYYDLPGAAFILAQGSDVAWVGGRSGLYRLSAEALTPVP